MLAALAALIGATAARADTAARGARRGVAGGRAGRRHQRRRAGLARWLLGRNGQPARLPRALVAAARRHAARRRLHRLPGQDAELRVPAHRVARGRRLLRRAAVRTAGDRVQARVDRRGRQGLDLHVRQSRQRLSAADHLPARRPRAGCTRRSTARSRARTARSSTRCAASTARPASSSANSVDTPASPALASFERMLAAGKDGALLRFSLGNEYLKAGDAGARRAASRAGGGARPRLHGGVEAPRPGAGGARAGRRRRSPRIAPASRSRSARATSRRTRRWTSSRGASRRRSRRIAPNERCATRRPTLRRSRERGNPVTFAHDAGSPRSRGRRGTCRRRRPIRHGRAGHAGDARPSLRAPPTPRLASASARRLPGVVGVALHPVPRDLVLRGERVELAPQVGVLDGLPVRGLPAVALPAVDPRLDAVLHVLRVGVELDGAARASAPRARG